MTFSPLGSISLFIVKNAAYKCGHAPSIGQVQDRLINELLSMAILKEYSFVPMIEP